MGFWRNNRGFEGIVGLFGTGAGAMRISFAVILGIGGMALGACDSLTPAPTSWPGDDRAAYDDMMTRMRCDSSLGTTDCTVAPPAMRPVATAQQPTGAAGSESPGAMKPLPLVVIPPGE